MYLVVYDTWPGIENAERELMCRIQQSCINLGINYISITNSNYILHPPELIGKSIYDIDESQIICVISLHFDSPKSTHLFTVNANWNPLDYYNEERYRNALNYDGMLSSYSNTLDQMVIRSNCKIVGYLNPTVPAPFMDVSITKYTCFYVGINWELLPGVPTPPRKKLLDILKLLDKSNEVNIYGPRYFHGIEVWKGYKTYRGDIPFDGVSTIQKIKDSGICLVFSSDSHKESEVCSNRLFEGLAAGVPLICDNNVFIRKWFGDNVLYIDTEDAMTAYVQIRNHIEYIKKHPKIVIKKMENCRGIFLAKFTMDKQLRDMIESVSQIKEQTYKEMKRGFLNGKGLRIQHQSPYGRNI